MIGSGSRALFQRFLPDHAGRAFVWKYAASGGGRRPRHFHAEPEVNLVVRGTAAFGIGDRVVRVSAGELLTFPSGQDHVLLSASPDLYLYAIGLDMDHSAQVLSARKEQVVPIHARLRQEELALVVDRSAALVDRADAHQLGAELWERIHWLAQRSTAGSRLSTHVLTRRAMQLMAAKPELGLDALAAEIGTHASEISRHFHADVGMTLVRYRMRVRLLRMIHLVDRGALDLMAAASAAGFGSYSQCHRTFQSELGCAPREFFGEHRDVMQRTYVG
jgi:AraC-like DNA-binding protein/mannose-6-phosphate isomerase-like protein (cupin superfamily)